ncbi:MAG: hypothetical protein L6V93_21905 [Clostridiales bacterium]|nr:MAG: hypothetical protein L6V93_21905 [Clostridiales bacterium]
MIQATSQKLTSSAGTKDWTKFIIYVNTETDTARLFVNNNASVPTANADGNLQSFRIAVFFF